MAARTQKKIFPTFRKRYFFIIFTLCILLVGGVILYKSLYAKPTYVYAKIKVGQGLWWAVTTRPAIWYVNAIKKGDIATDLLGRTEAKVLSKRYYRWYAYDQYDVFLDVQLKANVNKKTNEYYFNRAALSVGSPIEMQFASESITGTVTALSLRPFDNKLVEKTVYITKKYANPWEYDAIQVGDKTFDGEDVVFEVLEKTTAPSNGFSYGTSYSVNVGSSVLEPSNYVAIKAKVKLKKIEDQWVLGEDQIVSAGRNLNIATPNFVFDNFIVSKIE